MSDKEGLNKSIIDNMTPLTEEQIKSIFKGGNRPPQKLLGGVDIPRSNFDPSRLYSLIASLEKRVSEIENKANTEAYERGFKEGGAAKQIDIDIANGEF